jgi:hypothetical protein
METTAALAEYVALVIAKGRIEKAKKRDKPLQTVQLEGGELIDDADGLASVRVPCPACAPDKPVAAFRALRAHLGPQALDAGLQLLDTFFEASSTIEVPAPYGLRAGETSYSWVDTSELDDTTLVWAIRKSVLKVDLNSEVLKGVQNSTEREYLEYLPRVGRAVHRGKRDRLERVTA